MFGCIHEIFATERYPNIKQLDLELCQLSCKTVTANASSKHDSLLEVLLYFNNLKEKLSRWFDAEFCFVSHRVAKVAWWRYLVVWYTEVRWWKNRSAIDYIIYIFFVFHVKVPILISICVSEVAFHLFPVQNEALN